MRFPERFTHQREVLTRLIAEYPRELVPYEKLRDVLRQYAPPDYEALRNGWVSVANDHPHDALALFLAAEALWGKDTPQTMRLLESARAKAPDFPWPARGLAALYSSGKLADPSKTRANLEVFFSMCPATSDGLALFLLSQSPASVQTKIGIASAKALRAGLEKEANPKLLLDYRRLWALEFRTRPPEQYDALRAQVAADVRRLESLNPKGDAQWQALLIGGAKQSGASEQTITAMEDRLISTYPHSTEAFKIVSKRWDGAHPEPRDQTDSAAWAKYDAERATQVKQWIRRYTDDTYVQRYLWFDTVSDDDWVSEKDGVAATDLFVRSAQDFEPHFIGAYFPEAAQFLLSHGWQPVRALDLVKQAKAVDEKEWARDQNDDNRTVEGVKQDKEYQAEQRLSLDGLILKAAMEAKEPREATQLQPSVEVVPPSNKKLESQYWWNRARLASIQNHKQDALAYYQLALQTRTDVPKPAGGELRDELRDEAHGLWRSQGGSETAWAVWNKSSLESTQQFAEGSWEKPSEAMPVFEIADLSGKTWRLKELQGKALLIDVWATWCGPCKEALPFLQEFYEKTKDRSDIQVLTFDIDEDLGLVPPYLKQSGYTFPVLPVYSAGLLDDYTVPQTWIVDPHGIWRWKEIGFPGGTYDNFERDILAKLRSAETQ